MAFVDLNEGADWMKVIYAGHDVFIVGLVFLHEHASIRLIQSHFTSDQVHQLRIGDLDDLDEFWKNRIPIDGDHR